MPFDLLHHWPLELITFWLFPLFFAFKFIHLGLLGLRGRGLPISSSRNRLHGAANEVLSAVLVAVGASLCGAFSYWLILAGFRQ